MVNFFSTDINGITILFVLIANFDHYIASIKKLEFFCFVLFYWMLNIINHDHRDCSFLNTKNGSFSLPMTISISIIIDSLNLVFLSCAWMQPIVFFYTKIICSFLPGNDFYSFRKFSFCFTSYEEFRSIFISIRLSLFWVNNLYTFCLIKSLTHKPQTMTMGNNHKTNKMSIKIDHRDFSLERVGERESEVEKEREERMAKTKPTLNLSNLLPLSFVGLFFLLPPLPKRGILLFCLVNFVSI